MLDQFVKTYNNQYIDVDRFPAEALYQCWDIVELYAQTLGVPKEPWSITLGPEGAAKEAWTVFDAHMQRNFIKVPAGQQIKGDINIYGAHGIYTEGHINIDLGNGTVFEQNADPDKSPAHISQRPTIYLLGSLRKKGLVMIEPATIISLSKDFDVPLTDDQVKYYSKHPGGYTELFTDFLKYNHDIRKQLEATTTVVPYAGPPLFTKKG